VRKLKPGAEHRAPSRLNSVSDLLVLFTNQELAPPKRYDLSVSVEQKRQIE